MTDELAVREQAPTMGLPDEHEFQRMERIAGALANSGMVPKAYRGKANDVLAAALAGRELGLSPMSAMQRIHVIDGKPTLSAEAMCALALAAGHEIWVDESSNESQATVHGQRKGSERTQTLTFTMKEAQAAGITGKSNWKSYPKAMLRARAISALCRIAFADVLAGYVYVPDELGAVTDEEGVPVGAIEAQVVENSGGTAPVPNVEGAADEQITSPSASPPDWVGEAAFEYGDAHLIEAAEMVRLHLNIGKPITGLGGLSVVEAGTDIHRRILERLEKDRAAVETSPAEDVDAS